MNQYFLKWQEGVTDFKLEQGAVLLLFGISIFLIFQAEGMTRKRLASAGTILCLLTFLPFTATLLLWGYSGFYDWQDLLMTVPVFSILALGGCLAGERSSHGTATALFCIFFLFLSVTNFHAFDGQETSEGYGIPSWAGEAFDGLQEAVGDRELQILGDNDLLMYVRLYSTNWYPVYGRDLWDTQAKGYVEYDYGDLSWLSDILAQDTISAGNSKILVSYVKETQPDCLIVLSSWESELVMPADYNLVTLSGQYIAYIKNTPEEEI